MAAIRDEGVTRQMSAMFGSSAFAVVGILSCQRPQYVGLRSSRIDFDENPRFFFRAAASQVFNAKSRPYSQRRFFEAAVPLPSGPSYAVSKQTHRPECGLIAMH
jgi:hypothetical protein